MRSPPGFPNSPSWDRLFFEVVGVVLFSLVCLAPGARADNVRVFILCGQSQGVNYDNNAANLPAALQATQSNVMFWYRFGWWPANSTSGVLSSNSTWVSLAPQAKGSTSVFSTKVPSGGKGFGPEITLGRDLALGFPGEKVAIVKYTYNSTSLAHRADRQGWNPADSNQIFAGMVGEVNAARAALVAAGHTPTVTGFLWIQGEGDQGSSTYANAYQANLASLFAGVRSEFNPNLVAATVRLSTGQITPAWLDYNATGFNTVRAAQVAVGSAGALNAWIDTDDLGVVSGTVHFNEPGTQAIGSRMAAACLGLATPHADPDADGFNNLAEMALGSDPVSGTSHPVISQGTAEVSGQSRLTLSFTPGRVAGLAYLVQASSDLSDWTEETDITALLTPGQACTHTDSANLQTSPRRFLRLRIRTE